MKLPPGKVRTQQFAPQSSEDGPMPQKAPITGEGSPANQLVVAPLAEHDLPEAERVFSCGVRHLPRRPRTENFLE